MDNFFPHCQIIFMAAIFFTQLNNNKKNKKMTTPIGMTPEEFYIAEYTKRRNEFYDNEIKNLNIQMNNFKTAKNKINGSVDNGLLDFLKLDFYITRCEEYIQEQIDNKQDNSFVESIMEKAEGFREDIAISATECRTKILQYASHSVLAFLIAKQMLPNCNVKFVSDGRILLLYNDDEIDDPINYISTNGSFLNTKTTVY